MNVASRIKDSPTIKTVLAVCGVWLTVSATAGSLGAPIDIVDRLVTSEREYANNKAPEVLAKIQQLEALIISIKYSDRPDREKEEDILRIRSEIELLKKKLACLERGRAEC